MVCIIDADCGGRSVTNDADNVIADLMGEGVDLHKHPVIYRDSERVWDRLLVVDGRFAGFAPLNVKDQGEAIEKLRSTKINLSPTELFWQGEQRSVA